MENLLLNANTINTKQVFGPRETPCNKIELVAFSKSIKAHLENEIFCRSGKYDDFPWIHFALTEGKMFYNYSTLW